ncbi:MAG: hypothetical protein QNJ55_27975 [Xenococcus sp. MO_188.B8]|nr:hypothetical protein [Xenococcus sp. MO_188.B8]
MTNSKNLPVLLLIIEETNKNATLLVDIVKKAAEDICDIQLPEKPIIDSLKAASLVIAYLDGQSCNAHKLIEIGYRIGVKKPLILMTNEDTDLQQQVPFEYESCNPDRESSKLFCQSAILCSWEELNQDSYKQETIDNLRELIRQQVKPKKINSSYAVAEILIDINHEHNESEKRSNSIFTMTSEKTDRLFHVEGSLAGVPITEALELIHKMIELNQWQHFSQEQQKLIDRLISPKIMILDSDLKSDIVAKIPFIFNKSEYVSKDLHGKAFLALITQYTLDKDSSSLLLKLLYYEVPNLLLEEAPCRTHLVCKNI